MEKSLKKVLTKGLEGGIMSASNDKGHKQMDLSHLSMTYKVKGKVKRFRVTPQMIMAYKVDQRLTDSDIYLLVKEKKGLTHFVKWVYTGRMNGNGRDNQAMKEPSKWNHSGKGCSRYVYCMKKETYRYFNGKLLTADGVKRRGKEEERATDADAVKAKELQVKEEMREAKRKDEIAAESKRNADAPMIEAIAKAPAIFVKKVLDKGFRKWYDVTSEWESTWKTLRPILIANRQAWIDTLIAKQNEMIEKSA